MPVKSVDEKVAITCRGIKHRANRRFREGNFKNPFSIDGKRPSPASSDIKKGMYAEYEVEMDKLMFPPQLNRTGFTSIWER